MKAFFLFLPLFAASALAQSNSQRNDSIVVTGTFEPMDLGEMDRSVALLPIHGADLLYRSWVDALELDPSIDLRQRGAGGIQGDISIRGGTFGQTLVLLNGTRVNDVQTAHHNLDIPIPLEAIDRVEVLHGTGSAIYGSDAIGGVVNVITRKPEASEVTARTAVGNFGVNQEAGDVVLVVPKVTEELSFARDFSAGFMNDRDYRSLGFSSMTRATTFLGATDVVLGYADKPFGANQFYGNYNSWEDTKTWFASISQSLGASTRAEFAFRRHSDLFVLFRDRPAVYANHHSDESYDGALRHTDQLGRNVSLHYGGEFNHESLISNNLGPHERSREAGYISLDVRALKRFSFTVGAREDLYGSLNSQFNPNVSAGYWLTPRIRLRAGTGRAFRLPTYTDLYYHDPSNLGNAGLKPESAWSYEGGVETVAANWLRAEVTVFRRMDRDGIDYVRKSLNDPWQATNFDRLNFTGVEAVLRARLPLGETLDLRYAGLHGVSDTSPAYYSKYAFNFPSHSATAEWRAKVGAVMVRTRVGTLQRIGQSAYAVWDAYAAWTRSRLRPFVQLTNLSGTQYQEIYGVIMPGRAAIVGLELHALAR